MSKTSGIHDALGDDAETSFDGAAGESFWTRNFFRIWFVLSIAFVIVYIVVSWFRYGQSFDDIVLTSGAPLGAYFKLATGLKEIFEAEFDFSVDLPDSQGSAGNVARLIRGEAAIGFVQSDAGTDSEVLQELGLNEDELRDIRIIAVLCDEVLQIVVRNDSNIQELGDLRGATINLGPRESGTYRVALRLLERYGLYAVADYTPKFHGLDKDLSDEFEDGSLDAAFYLMSLKTQPVSDLLALGNVKLLPIGSLNSKGLNTTGAIFDLPGTKTTVIPPHTYGTYPEEPIGTLAVEALLVTTRQQSANFIHQITEAIFQNRYTLMEHHPAASQMHEIRDANGLRFAVHPGALEYYNRDEPPFLVKYAQTFSFLLAFLLSATSGIIGLIARFKKKRKDRIDIYYLRVEKLAEEISGANDDTLRAARKKLLAIRREALHDLVGERIKADASFLIFQDFLGQLLSEIRQTLELRAKGLADRRLT